MCIRIPSYILFHYRISYGSRLTLLAGQSGKARRTLALSGHVITWLSSPTATLLVTFIAVLAREAGWNTTYIPTSITGLEVLETSTYIIRTTNLSIGNLYLDMTTNLSFGNFYFDMTTNLSIGNFYLDMTTILKVLETST